MQKVNCMVPCLFSEITIKSVVTWLCRQWATMFQRFSISKICSFFERMLILEADIRQNFAQKEMVPALCCNVCIKIRGLRNCTSGESAANAKCLSGILSQTFQPGLCAGHFFVRHPREHAGHFFARRPCGRRPHSCLIAIALPRS